MKSVLISIQPKWVEKIANGQKTIEVRKTIPKIDTPFKCYIYETQGEYKTGTGIFAYGIELKETKKGCGKVIGEFICDRITEWTYFYFADEYIIDGDSLRRTCLLYSEFENYGKGKTLYGWHISNLKIYDNPKKLSDFRKPFPLNKECVECERGGDSYSSEDCSCCEYWSDKDITRPPQSWQFVESLGE